MNRKPPLLSNPWTATHRRALATVARWSGLELERVVAALGSRCSTRRYHQFAREYFRDAA